MIPKAVKELADKIGCNDPVFVGVIDGAEVYSANQYFDVPEGEPYPPTGLPTYIVYKDGKASEVYGLAGLHLARRLAES